MEEIIENPQELEKNGRNTDGTFALGHEKIPGSGRPKNTLKDFVRHKLQEMTDEEKEKWLESYKIPGIDIWKMAEGNPKEQVEHSGEIGLQKLEESIKSLTSNT